MKKAKTILTLVLALALAFTIFGCAKEEGGSGEPSASPSASASASPSASAEQPSGGDEPQEWPSYEIGINNLGAGNWILDLLVDMPASYMQNVGMNVTSVSANFSSDQMLKDCQNLVQSGIEGHMYFGAFSSLTPAISDVFQAAEVYFGMHVMMPTPEVMDVLNANPYYAGSVGTDNAYAGEYLAKAALEHGCRKAVMMAGHFGDPLHDGRTAGFQVAFEAGGGEILAVARCTDPSEAAMKSDDIFAAYGDDMDCFFAINMDYVPAVLNSMTNFGYADEDVFLVCGDADAQAVDLIDQGRLMALTTCVPESVFNTVLVLNALDGQMFYQPDGNAPTFANHTVCNIIPVDKTDLYRKFWLESYPVPQEDYNNLLYRFNPDASYDSFIEYINNFTFDYVITHN